MRNYDTVSHSHQPRAGVPVPPPGAVVQLAGAAPVGCSPCFPMTSDADFSGAPRPPRECDLGAFPFPLCKEVCVCVFSIKMFTHRDKNCKLSLGTHVVGDRVPSRERTFHLFPETFPIPELGREKDRRRLVGLEKYLALDPWGRKDLTQPGASEEERPYVPARRKGPKGRPFSFSLHTGGGQSIVVLSLTVNRFRERQPKINLALHR